MQDERECAYCDDKSVFKSRAEFMQHLRSSHCSREGGSYVCKYGYNGVCASLPVEGVDDKDYEQHVCKQHLGPDSSFANSRRRSSVLSLSGTATGSTRSWTLYSASQNLATVLNDPNRGKQKDLFTKTWGESFVEKTMVSPSPLLEPVTIMDLAPYLRKNSKRYRKLLKRKALFSPNVSAKPTAVPATSDHVDLPKVDQLVQIFPKLSSLKVHENVIGDLNSIPEIFHGSDFDLSRLDQFERVFPENRNASKLVQEQLSHYLDMVEINIAAQIAQNSEAYFKTMSCHDVLMADLNTTTSKVRVLRAEMSRLRKTLVEGPMQIIALFQQRSRAAVLLKTLKVMRTVHQTQGTVQLLLATSDFVGALDLIATTHDVLEENLKNLRCFRHLGTQLRELEKIIGRVLVTDFYRWVTGFLNRPELPETRSSGEEEDGRDRLSAIVFGLVKLGETKVMLDTLREESGAALKALVKQVLAETLTRSDVVSAAVEDKEDDGASGGVEDGGGKRGVAADISGLDMQAWFAFFKDLCANVVALLKRIKSLNGLIGDMVSTAAEANEAKDDAAKSARVEELMTGLNAAVVWACNMAHERIARVILASGKCLDKCSASDYRALNTCIKEFSLATEHISGKKMSHVWSALHGQTQKFIARFHDSHKAKLGMLLDNERWQAAKVPRELQQLVDNIFTLGKFTASPKQLPEQDAGNPFAELAVATSHLAVEGQQFIVVGVVLMLVRDVGEYCDLARENISLASDLLTRLSDLLGFYNSRMSQLLLGAGALSSAGLRTISAKNLALGWRSLQLVQAMLPRIKAFFEEILLTRASGIRQLDQVTRDVEAHGMGLCSKLSQIVDTGMEMQLARWELKPPVPSLAFKSICKQLVKLNEAVSDVLPHSQLDAIYSKVHASFRSRIHANIIKSGIKNDGGPDHGLITAELTFYVEQLKSLKCFVDPRKLESFHEEVWKES